VKLKSGAISQISECSEFYLANEYSEIFQPVQP